MNNNLKSCPFCGNMPNITQSKPNHSSEGIFKVLYTLKCEKCNIGFSCESQFQLVMGQPKFIINGYDTVVSKWNKRAKDI